MNELDRLPLAGRSVVDPKQDPKPRRQPVPYKPRHVTFNDTDRNDRRLALLEERYASDPEYAAIPEKSDSGTVHYWRIDELEAYARAHLIAETIRELIPDADTDAHSVQAVLWTGFAK